MTDTTTDTDTTPTLRQSQSIANLAAALAKAQGKFKPIKKAASTSFETKRGDQMSYDYADLADVISATRPALSKNGLALLTPVRIRTWMQEGDNGAFLVGEAIASPRLVHSSGEWIECDFAVQVADTRDARSRGSASTYAKKYGVQGLLGVSPEREDDDGEAARGGVHEQAQPEPEPQQQRQPQARQRAPAAPTAAELAQAAKIEANDAVDVDTRAKALETGIAPEGYTVWAEKILGRQLPKQWNRTLSDAERQALVDEVAARRELGGKPPVVPPKKDPLPNALKTLPKNQGPIQDAPIRKPLQVVDYQDSRGTPAPA